MNDGKSTGDGGDTLFGEHIDHGIGFGGVQCFDGVGYCVHAGGDCHLRGQCES